MTMKQLLLGVWLSVLIISTTSAQESQAIASPPAPASGGYSATPAHMWELGVHGGYFFNIGDIESEPGFGAGIHIRRAIDYLFSVRMDLQYGVANGGAQRSGVDIADYKNTWYSGSVQALVSLNNMKWDKPRKSTNLYAFFGGGANSFEVDYTHTDDGNLVSEHKIATHMDAGLGAAFRISKRFNIGIEHKAIYVLGKRADFIDAWDNKNYNRTSFRDVLNYSHVRLNFNLGKSSEKAEPLYWVNPLDGVLTDVSELKARPKLDLTDEDEDGVIDMVDQEPGTPKGAPVDTRGVALDSDKDGIKDYEDKEPFSPPGYEINEEGIAKTNFADENTVNGIVDKKLADWKKDNTDSNGLIALGEKAGLSSWFLPMIHFNNDSEVIRTADYGNLAGIAYVMKENPALKILVTGYTDQTASDSYNEQLSYNRALKAIDFLVTKHQIPRERFVLHYGGEKNNLVPSTGSNFMNRRVEFNVARNETDMAPPAGAVNPDGKFKGNREAGY